MRPPPGLAHRQLARLCHPLLQQIDAAAFQRSRVFLGQKRFRELGEGLLEFAEASPAFPARVQMRSQASRVTGAELAIRREQ